MSLTILDSLTAMAQAEAGLHAAAALDRPERPTWAAVITAAGALADAIENWRLIESGDLHWDTAYPWLLAEVGEEAGYGAALGQAFDEAEAARTALGLAMSEHCTGKTGGRK
jgi:hypothetical protein